MSKHIIGANDFDRCPITVTYVENKWPKYIAMAALVVAIRFLCCA